MAIRELSLEMEHGMLLLESLGLEKKNFTNGVKSLDSWDPMQREVHKVVFMFSFPLHED
jgi:hypothetical protein